MRDGKILIVGGYGAVGRVISTRLGNLFPAQVIVAGRSYKKAKEFSNHQNQNIIPLELDITSISNNDKRLKDISLVIMCIDQNNIRFVSECIHQGIHYIDITANHSQTSKITSFHNEAEKNGSTIVLSVGLAPGLTNLLASHCKSIIPDMKYAEIYVLLGLGEIHGEAAIRWSLEELNKQYNIQDSGTIRSVRSFEDGKQTIFPGRIGKRTTYNFNFSDQHVITKTLEIDFASTRMCFDSKIMTYLYALSKKIGLSKFFKFRIAQSIMIKILQIFHFGSDQFIVKVEAGISRKNGHSYECSISGNGEGLITGLVTAKVAEKLFTSSFNSGVFHIEEMFNLFEIIENYDGTQLAFQERVIKEK